jgi:hypothetical protein
MATRRVQVIPLTLNQQVPGSSPGWRSTNRFGRMNTLAFEDQPMTLA